MERLINLANKNIDKILHFVFAYSIAVTMTLVFRSLWIGLSIAAAVSILKEAFDQWRYKGWSWGDLLADFVGIDVAYVVCLITMWGLV